MSSLGQEEFFNGYWGYLEANGISSVILHSWQEYPRYIASDVDYCVPQKELGRVLPLLECYCEQSGWSLCQIFQHEKTAYFCVCASKTEVDDLIMLDVCGDYTVRGVRQVSSEVFIENRKYHAQKKFWVLNPAAELTYVLTKAAAKKKNPIEVMVRVTELLSLLSVVERKQAAEYLPQQNILSSSELLECPSAYLEYSDWARRVGESSGSNWLELLRKVRRVLQPTGFYIEIKSLSIEDSNQAAEMFVEALADTCRNTLIVRQGGQKSSKKSWKSLALAKIKSTLVVSCSVDTNNVRSIPMMMGADFTVDLPRSWHEAADHSLTVVAWALEVRFVMAERTRRRWFNK